MRHHQHMDRDISQEKGQGRMRRIEFKLRAPLSCVLWLKVGALHEQELTKASKQSRPSIVTEYIGRGIKFFAGSLPFAKAVRGNVSDDPRVEEDFYADRKSTCQRS